MRDLPFVPYPPIAKLGLVGDRRTAGLIAADGTVAWFCLPSFDGEPVFACLLDAEAGGHFRVGPTQPILGRQAYLDTTFGLVTTWRDGLELTDLMLWPADDRAEQADEAHVLVRRLRATQGAVSYRMSMSPRSGEALFETDTNGGAWRLPLCDLGLFSSRPLQIGPDAVRAEGRLAPGEEAWFALCIGQEPAAWSVKRLRSACNDALAYWRDWAGQLTPERAVPEAVRAALLTQCLTFAPSGAVVATPSASLPERIGGSRNFDYRFSWIRDGALAMAILAEVGAPAEAERYLDWISHRSSRGPMPLQVVYRADGSCGTGPIEKQHMAGYRESKPVLLGNQADKLWEIDSFGYLLDCVYIHARRGGALHGHHWAFVLRLADFVAENWQQPGASIWEITPPHDFVAGKVLSWVTLDRALRLAEMTGRPQPNAWIEARDAIHAEVCERGYDADSHSFRQRYGSDAVDAALLLIPLMGFLPVDDPRVTGTVDRIVAELTIDGHVHRFVPSRIPNQGQLPLGEEEGSFLLCTCWLAQVRARQGRLAEAKAALARVAATTENGLLSEGVDARSGALLGNMPLLFTHVEYARAAWAIAEAEGRISAPPR